MTRSGPTKKLFSVFSLITFCLSMQFLTACTRSSGTPQDTRTLTMGLSADYPPFEFKKNGEVVGLDVDVAQEIAKELGVRLSIQDMDFAGLVPALQTGRIDFAMSGMTVTEERKKNIDFSDVYFTSSFALILANESKFSKEQDLQGKRIGAQLGTTMEKFVKEKAKAYSGVELVALAKNPTLIQELKSGRIFGVVSEQVQAAAFVEANPGLKYVSMGDAADGYAIAFAKQAAQERPQGQALLRDQVNDVLLKLKKNGKLDSIRKKWLGQ